MEFIEVTTLMDAQPRYYMHYTEGCACEACGAPLKDGPAHCAYCLEPVSLSQASKQ